MDDTDATPDSSGALDADERIAQLEDLVLALGDVIDTMVLVATQTGDTSLQRLIDLCLKRSGLLGEAESAFTAVS